MSNSIKLFLILITCVLGFVLIASAQETLLTEVSPEVIEAINLDEDIQPEDLGIGEPRLLPDSPFYFLKNWGRNIQSFFTFDSVKKAELKLKFANEKLMEVKKLIEEKKGSEVIEKGLENYQKEIENIKIASEKIKEKAKESPEVSSFLDKFIKHQVLHQNLLQRLETQVPPQVFEKIEEVREGHLERFAEVMTKLEDRMEELRERLEKNLEEIEGSKYKNFKNLEVLLELEEKVPEKAKEAIQGAQENTLKRLKSDLEKMSPEDQEKFKEYLEKIGGVKEKQLEILENLKEEFKEEPEVRKKLIQSRDRILEKIKQNETEKLQVCITLWDPVCGKDGKTYSNECFAKVAGVEIDYKGVCKKQLQLKKGQP